MSILNELFNEDFSKELHEQQLNELTQPYSRTSSSINRAKSAVKGLVGGGQYEQGAEQAGQLANSYFMNFKRYIGSKYGTKPKFVTYNDVKDFMSTNKLDISGLGSNQNMTFTPKDVAGIFLKAAQEQVSSGMVPPSSQNNDTTTSQENGTNQPVTSQGSNQPVPAPQGNTNVSGTLASLSPAERAQLLSILSKI